MLVKHWILVPKCSDRHGEDQPTDYKNFLFNRLEKYIIMVLITRLLKPRLATLTNIFRYSVGENDLW